MTTITPTNGRIVWFTPPRDAAQGGFIVHGDKPLAAMIVHVWSDRMVNLIVFDSNGTPHPFTSVDLVQSDEDKAALSLGRYAEWMPYQKGQAAKTEAAEAALSASQAGMA